MSHRPGNDVRLSALDRQSCQQLLRGGSAWVWRVKRAQILLQMDQGRNARVAGASVSVAENTARRVARRYRAKGLEYALSDDPRPGGKRLLNESESQLIVAMVCSHPPDGRARWTIRLIAQEAIRRGIVARVDKETIRVLLGNHELKPWREKNVGDSGADERVRHPDGRGPGRLPEAA